MTHCSGYEGVNAGRDQYISTSITFLLSELVEETRLANAHIADDYVLEYVGVVVWA